MGRTGNPPQDRSRSCRTDGAALSCGLLALVALALPAAPAAAAQTEWTDYDRPATHAVTKESNVPIEMRDGVVLRANVERPAAEGRFPVLVTQTPYGKDGVVGLAFSGASNYFAARGYVVVTVDVRGTGSSQGQWDSFGPDEQRDGVDVVKWARTQPWSTGKIGLFGSSYLAITQLTTAARDPKGLEAIFPVVPMGDGYRDIVFSGGQINTGFIPFWLGLVTAGSFLPIGEPPSEPGALLEYLTGTLRALTDHLAGAVNFQTQVLLSAIAGGELAYDGPFWKTRSPLELVDRIRVPAFVVGGHRDLFQRGEPLIYERLKRHVPARLLMGPWTHIQGATGGGLPRDGVPGLNQIQLRWFDHYLLGLDTKPMRMPKVTQYAYGAERYITQPDWPDPRLRAQRRYLRGGGRLDGAAPDQPEAPQSFLQNPLSGICTPSTGQWTAGLGDVIRCDPRVNEALGGAVYTSKPLKRRLHLSGAILANLWVTTTAKEAVTTVRVGDVAPNGTATDLTAGWLAASFRKVDRTRSRYLDGRLLQPWHPFTKESVLPVTPGEPTRLPVEIFPTRAVLKEGHRLKISIQGGDFPHQVPPLPQLTGSLTGSIEILTEPGHASYLELPGLRRGCGGGCKALPVPNLIRGE